MVCLVSVLRMNGHQLDKRANFSERFGLSRSQSDFTWTSSSIVAEMEGNKILSKRTMSSPTLKPEGTPTKVLEPEEISKDMFLGIMEDLAPRSLEKTRITILKPSKTAYNDNFPAWRFDESVTTPTQIVVLKPSCISQRAASFEKYEDSATQQARKVAKEITNLMRVNLGGYTGNESDPGFSGDLYDSLNSCASCSPECSVAVEAKRRLLRRWALAASEGSCEEQRQSTLGEMLDLSKVQQSEIVEVDDQPPRFSTSYLSSNTGGDFGSPGNLLRSKSLPKDPSASARRLGIEAQEKSKKITKSSFRLKLASFFSPKSKKQPKDQDLCGESPCNNKYSESEDVQSTSKQTIHANLKLNTSGGASSEKPDRPSLISIMEPPFDVDGCSTMSLSGDRMDHSLGRSNLIGKSPPIGSVARTLSSSEPFVLPRAEEEEEDECRCLIESLLSLAELGSESNLAKWHSLESPLDPSLRERLVDLAVKEPLHEPRWSQVRSRCWLVFDSVNAALADTSCWVHDPRAKSASSGAGFADRVCARMKGRSSSGVREAEDGGDEASMAADVAVKEELTGEGWNCQKRLEVEIIGGEIERKLLEELVEESVAEFTGKPRSATWFYPFVTLPFGS